MPVCCPAAQALIVSQTFCPAIQCAALLKRLDQLDLGIHSPCAACFCHRERQRLQTIVFQHDGSDFVCHLFQQSDAALFCELACAFCVSQRNLDVHFIVRAIHASRIIDEIRIAAPTIQAKFDPSGLRNAEVRAFTDGLGTQVLRIDTQSVIARVTHARIVFCRGFDVGANPAEPDQVDRAFQDCADQSFWLPFGLFYAQCLLRRFGQSNGLGIACKNAPAF